MEDDKPIAHVVRPQQRVEKWYAPDLGPQTSCPPVVERRAQIDTLQPAHIHFTAWKSAQRKSLCCVAGALAQ